MGFAVWMDKVGKAVWVQGTHEYRPMGAAVAVTSACSTTAMTTWSSSRKVSIKPLKK